MSEVELFGSFGRHTPKILRRQLIRKLIDEYLQPVVVSKTNNPTFQRFHGALLFVDISGFTSLSLRLELEELKNHINDYFTKMLTIVEKNGGDVIKFAGDAIYIVWQTTAYSTQDSTSIHDPSGDIQQEFKSASKAALEKAVNCALEISKACCNHEIHLDPLPQEPAPNTRKILPSLNFFTNASTPAEKENTVAYLNVHTGVSAGLMAGVDVGANDRWEYFLVGEPLSRVAHAESLAEVGDVVLCPTAHELIHPQMATPKRGGILRMSAGSLRLTGNNTFRVGDLKVNTGDPNNNNTAASVYPCGCNKLENGYARISRINANNDKRAILKKSRTKAKLDDTMTMDDSFMFSTKMQDELLQDVVSCFQCAIPSYKQEFQERLEVLNKEFDSSFVSASSKNKGITNFHLKYLKDYLEKHKMTAEEFLNKLLLGDELKQHAMKWVHECLLDDMARHIHEVARTDYRFKNIDRSQPFIKLVETIIEPKEDNTNSTTINTEDNSANNNNNCTNDGSTRRDSTTTNATATTNITTADDAKNANLIKLRRTSISMNGSGFGALKKLASVKNIVFKDTSLEAEIRSVIVMFIKIDMIKMEILVENPDELAENVMRCGNPFSFIRRTNNEILSDNMLAQKVQSCVEVLTSTLSTNGGQMRQFIVDDKGTVCIGTFGLKGAVSDDNAANALEAAKSIIVKLQGLGHRASIGITSGKAYCGLVGSPVRHEYAVMGPSTNLSARLMCKAPPCGVICDGDSKNRDRTHQFENLGTVQAKGYKDPVPTFRPEYKDVLEIDFIKSAQDYASLFSSLNVRSSFDAHVVRSSFDHGMPPEDDTIRNSGKFEVSINFNHLQQSTKVTKAAKLVKQMTKKEFFHKKKIAKSGSNSNLLKANVAKANLRGRHNEIDKIIEFCFVGMMLHLPENEASNNNGESSPRGTKQPMFDISIPSKMLTLIGPQGIGKASIVSAVTHQMYTTSRVDTQYNVSLFKNQRSSYHHHNPFSAWKTIFREILVTFPRPNSPTMANIRRSQMISSFDDVSAGLDYILSLLPAAVRELKPLLASISFIRPMDDNATTVKLTGQAKLNRTADLLTVIVQLYVSYTKNLVIFALEEVQTFDVSSLQLLHLIWSQNTGIVIMTTYRPTHNTLSQDVDKLNSPNTMHNHLALHHHQFLSLTVDSSSDLLDFVLNCKDVTRFMKLEVSQLESAAIEMLIKDAFAAHEVRNISQATVQTLTELSGGNPLYAYELTKAITETTDHSLDPEVLNKVVASMRSNRIEEVICHRFDQLDSASQMVLKMMAVACANGSVVSFELLAFIMDEEESSNFKLITNKEATKLQKLNLGFGGSFIKDGGSSVNQSLYNAIVEILKHDEFIQIVSGPDGTDGGSFNLAAFSKSPKSISMKASLRQSTGAIPLAQKFEQAYISKCTFDFRISIEQMIIYDLLLDDQKLFIHERVALYYNINQREETANDMDLLCEEGFHWQHATVWNAAMTCYYKAALTLQSIDHEHINSHKGLLAIAYSMFKSICHEVEVPIHHQLTMEEMKGLFTTTSTTNAAATSAIVPLAPKHPPMLKGVSNISGSEIGPERSLLNIEDIFLVFGGETDMLNYAIKMFTSLANKRLLLFEGYKATNQILEDALIILTQTKNPYIINSSQILKVLHIESKYARGEGKISPRGFHRSNSGGARSSGGGVVTDDTFCCKDYDTLLFPLLSVYIENNIWVLEIDSIQKEKLFYISEKYLELTKEKSEETKLHLIQAYMQAILLHLYHGNSDSFDQVRRYAELLFDTYNFDAYSRQLCEMYQADKAAQVFSLVSQQLLLHGEWELAYKYLNFSLEITEKTKHVLTIGMSLVATCSSLIFLHRNQDAFNLYDNYLKLRTDQVGFDYLTTEISKILQEWITRILKYEQYKDSKFVALTINDNEEIDEILKEVGLSDTIESGHRPYLYDFLYCNGRGLESIFSELCLIKVLLQTHTMKDNVAEANEILETYFEAAQTYNDYDMKLLQNNNLKFHFNKLNCYLIKYKLHDQMSFIQTNGATVKVDQKWKSEMLEFAKHTNSSGFYLSANVLQNLLQTLVLSKNDEFTVEKPPDTVSSQDIEAINKWIDEKIHK